LKVQAGNLIVGVTSRALLMRGKAESRWKIKQVTLGNRFPDLLKSKHLPNFLKSKHHSDQKNTKWRQVQRHHQS
jgi:hypothetical protein